METKAESSESLHKEVVVEEYETTLGIKGYKVLCPICGRPFIGIYKASVTNSLIQHSVRHER